jgi:sugar/nucleoside kinase (ribokinase family)
MHRPERGPEYFHVVAAHPASALVDTTGAGDLYAAGFLYGFIASSIILSPIALNRRASANLVIYPSIALLVAEAGGRCTTFDGEAPSPGGCSLLSTNGLLHDEAVAALAA